MNSSQQPAMLLVCCEGKETEPQYFTILAKFLRIQRLVKIVGAKKQHKQLVDEAVIECEKLLREKELALGEVEVWVVCDKDSMPYPLEELEVYARKNNVNLAFSDPMFEIFLLQHFSFSSSPLKGKRELMKLLTKEINKRIPGNTYNPLDLSLFGNIFDEEPIFEQAVKYCQKLEDKKSSPYTTCHKLVERLIELAPRVG